MFDEVAQFRVQYAAALLVSAVVFGLRRKFRAGFAFGAFAVVNLAIILPYCFTGRSAGPPSGQSLRIVLLNVHTENQRYDRVEQFLRSAQADVIILEEV